MARTVGRALLVGAVAASATTLAACGAVKVEGTLVGRAFSCSPRSTKVTVAIFDDTTLYTTRTVKVGTPFTVHLSPGHYLVSVEGAAKRFTMENGATEQVTLQPTCS